MAKKVYESGRHTVVSEERKWAGKPALAFLVRSSVYVVPIAASIFFSIWLSKTLPAPESVWALLGWWAAIIGASTGVLFIVDRGARRLLPLAALLQMTMVFPDKSPSRYRTALKSGSSIKNLNNHIAAAQKAGVEGDATSAAEVILQLSSALNAHDPQTRGHSERVRAYSEMLAEELGVSEEDRAKLRWSSLLHDIGKLQVPTEILNKAGKLDDDEWNEIKRHPTYGVALAGPLVEWLGEWSAAIEDHHERYDGFGYPNKKTGESISLAGRIVAVADAYDVMTTARSYKKPMPAAAAREELARHAGAQFDPDVVRAFLELSMGRLRWIAGPLSWLAQLPFLRFAGGIQSVGTSVGVAAAAASGAAAALAGGLIDMPDDALTLPPPPQALVNYVGTPLAANGDAFSIAEGSSQTLPILANDTIVDGSEMAIIVDPRFGTVIINADGTVTYIPADGHSGGDSFTYQVTAPNGSTSSATVTITIEDVNGLPVAVADTATVEEDATVTIDVLANDTDAEGFDVASLRLGTAPLNGAATLAAGRFTYAPTADYHGTDGFTYTVTDTDGVLVRGSVAIAVLPVNDPPVVPGPPPITIDDGQTVSFDPLRDATDVDGDTLTIVAFDKVSAAGGSIAEGSLIYTSPINHAGADGFTYEVTDGTVTVSVPVYITVIDVNYPPVVKAPPPLSIDENTTGTIDVLAGATDKDGDAISISAAKTGLTTGTVVINGDGTVTYTPPENWTGSDSFGLVITDGVNTLQVTVSVMVNDVNYAPVIGTPIVATTNEDTAITLDLLTGVTDVDGDPLAVVGVDTTGTVGSVINHGDGTVTYTPAPDFNGADAFGYTVGDGALTITGTASLIVTAVDDPPVLAPLANATVAEQVKYSFIASASEADGQAVVFTLEGAPTGAVITKGTGKFSWTPSEAAGPGTYTFDVVATDDGGTADRATITLTVTEVNRPPVLAAVAPLTVDEDKTLSVTFTATDPDLPSSTLTFSVSGAPATAVVNPTTGAFTWSPKESHGPGTYTFNVTVSDGGSPTLSASTAVTVTVGEVNRPPVIQPVGNQALNEGELRDVPITSTDPDLPANGLTLSVSGAPGFVTLVDNGNGTGFLRLAPGFFDEGNYPITVSVSDNGSPAMSHSDAITISVGNVNRPPDISNQVFSVVENSAGTVVVGVVPVTEPDGETVTFAITGPNPGFTIDPSTGAIRVGTVALDFETTTSYTITVAATDNGAPNLTDTATVTINVVDVNDAPAVVPQSFDLLEESLTGTVVGTVAASDEDAAQTLSFAISGINPGFAIDAYTGEITVDTVEPDFESGTTTYSLTVDVTDDGVPNLTTSITVTVNVIDVLFPPVAADDAYATDVNTVLNVPAPGLLGNDSDEDGDPLVVDTTPVTSPTNGALVLNADGSFTYTPAIWFVGTDTFSYRIDDGAGGSDTADVSIVVDDGVAAGALYLTSAGTGDEYAFGASPEPNVDPVPDYEGDGSPGHTIDASGGDPDEDDPQKYQRWVWQPSTPMALNGPVTLDLWSTVKDFDPNDDIDLDVAIFDCAPDGTGCVLLLEHHRHVDTWNGGIADWTYRSFDLGLLDATILPTRQLEMKLMFGHNDVWVAMAGENPGPASRLTFTSANASPVAFDDVGTVGEDDPATPINVLLNDVDTNLDPASVTVTGGPGAARTGVPNPVTGAIPYTAAGSFEALDQGDTQLDTFTYQVCDTSGSCDSATVTITVSGDNDAPVANDDGPGVGYATDEDSPFTTDRATDNDTDVDADDSFTVVAFDTVTPAGAVVADGGGGKFDYDPNGQFESLAEGETITDTFGYTIEDGWGAQSTATVTIDVLGVNDDPVVADQGFSVAENSASTVVIGTVVASDVDASDTLSYAITGANPGFAIDSSTGVITVGSVALDYETTTSYTLAVEVTDDSPSTGTDTAVVTITVTDVAELPTANDDGPGPGYATDQDTALTTGNVLSNDVDPDGFPLLVQSIDTTGTAGLVVDNGNGTFGYDPNGAFDGLPGGATATDTFVYTLVDSQGYTDSATVAIEVAGRNDAPVLAAIGNQSLNEADTVTVPLSALEVDVPPNTLVFTSTALPGFVTLVDNGDGTGWLSMSPGFFDEGNYPITITVQETDGVPTNLTDSESLTITVGNVNRPPNPQDDSLLVIEDGSVVFTEAGLLGNDSDPDGDTVLFDSITTSPLNATITPLGGGSYQLSPNPAYEGTDSFQYRVTDGSLFATATVNVTVKPKEADLAVQILSALPNPSVRGVAMTLGLEVSSAGPDSTGGTTVTIPLPAGSTFVSDTGGSCSGIAGPAVSCDVGNMVNGEVDSFDVTVTLGSVGNFDLTATVTASQSDPDLSDNSDSINVTVLANLPPSVTPLQAFSVSEAAPNTTVVGTVAATDPDSTVQSFAITGGDPAGVFAIDAGGQITVADRTTLDYETITSYSLSVTASDEVNTSPAETVTITVTDANDNAPVIDPAQVFSVSEAAPVTTVVGTVTATDADTTPITGFTLTAGNGDGIFGIDAGGQITVVNTTNLDYETTTQYVLSVTASDGVNTSAAETVTIDITDANDNAPIVDPAQVFSVLESAANGTVVGTVIASDADTTPVTGFTITAGNGAGVFGINASGQITVVDRSNLDYETTIQYLLSVTATDGVNTSAAETVTIDVTDVVEGAGLVISEFRTVDVQFIEIYNGSSTPSVLTGLDVAVYPGNGSSTPSDVIALPSISLPAFEHLLIGPAGLTPNIVHAVAIDQYGGIAIRNGAAIIDAVGTNGRPGGAANESGSFVVEGTGLPPMTVAAGVAQSYERRHGNVASSGNCVDTNNNADDFVHNFGSANPQASGTSDPCGAAPTAPASTALSVVISELRGDGPAGGSDDFVEIFNPTGLPVVMDGWTIGLYDGGWTTGYTFGTFTLNPGEHFLLTGATYSGSVAGDASYGTELKNGGGVRIHNGTSAVDLVGMGTSPAEGTALPAFAGRSDHSYERRGGGAWGSCVDSGDNLADFTHRFTSDPQSQASDATPCAGAPANPPVFSLASYSYVIARGTTVGTVVGTTPAFDPDPDTLNYTITSQFPAGQFSINAAGELRLALPLPNEIAVPPPYTATVRVDDGTGLFDTAPVSFGLTDKVSDLTNSVAATPGLSILVGNEVSLAYTVTNDGPDQTPGTKIHHYYTPSEFFWNSGASSPGCSTGITGQVRCSYGTLFAAGSEVRSVVMRALKVGSYSMTSYAFTGSSFDPNVTNNGTAVTVTVSTSTPSIDLALYVANANPATPATGTDFSFSWVAKNHGATAAPSGSIVTATLPAGVTFQAGSATNGPPCTYLAPVVSCTITPAMASGQNEAGSMTLRSSSSGLKNVVFTLNPPDTIPANNTVNKSVTIL